MIKKILGAIGSFFRKIRIKPLIICVAVLLVLGAAYIFFFKKMLFPVKQTASQEFATARLGDINVTVSGSGPLESSNSVDITPKINGTITKMYFKEGDKVKAGALMYELDDSDAVLNVQNVQNQIAQTELSQDTNIKSINALNVTAPFPGQVTDIQVKAGDKLGNNSPVLTITDKSRLKLTVPFSGINIEDINTGMKADVYLQGVMQSVQGTVTAVDNKPGSTSSGAASYDVEVTIKNPGSLKDGMKAGVEINTRDGAVTSADVGTLQYINSSVIKSETGGTVDSLEVVENQNVKSGQQLLVISNDDLTLNKNTTDLKLKNLQSQLDAANKQVGYCKIYAPIDGVIVSQAATEGSVVKSGDALSTISDSGHMQFEISVDELDIAKIKTGQQVNITVDALTDTTNNPLSGVVSKIALQGDSSNGVTTYPVTINVTSGSNLKVGMNANAEVMVEQKQNVLIVPLEAIHKMGNRNYVLIRSDGSNNAASGNFGGFGPGNWNGQQPDSSNRNGNGSGQNQGRQDRAESGQGTASGNNNTDKNNGNSGNSSNSTNNGNNSGNSGYDRSNGNGGYNRSNGNGGYDRSNGNGGYGGYNRNNGNSGYNGNGNGGYNGNGNGSRRSQLAGAMGQNSGTVIRFVEVGINNENYIEVVSGLNEGDQVALPVLATASNNSNSNSNRMMLGGLTGGGGFGGGMGGGMGGGFNVGNNNRQNRSSQSGGNSNQRSGNNGRN